MQQTPIIAGLIVKYLRSELTEEEANKLEMWLNQDSSNRFFFKELTKSQTSLREGLYEYIKEDIDADTLWNNLDDMRVSNAYVTTKSRRIWQYAASAAIVTGIAFAYWLLPHKGCPTNALNPVGIQQEQLKPGGNKAVLTLSSGESIVLDSAKNGQLARQGLTTIVKTDNGRLAYIAKGRPTHEFYNTLTTPKGGQYIVILPDDSRIWLNSESSIRFPVSFGDTDRKVEITGEVYCEITPNHHKPFRVLTGETEVEVVGTTFNINAYKEEEAINTTLLTGIIKLKTYQQPSQLILEPGQQVKIPKALGAPLRLSSDINVDQVIGWKDGLFAFYKDNVPTIMRQIARWYDLQVVYEGEIPNIVFSGKISRNTNAANIFKILEDLGVHFRIEGKKVIVTK